MLRSTSPLESNQLVLFCITFIGTTTDFFVLEPVKSMLSMQELSTFAALHKKAGQFLSKSTLHHVNLASWFSYYDVIKNAPSASTPSSGIVV